MTMPLPPRRTQRRRPRRRRPQTGDVLGRRYHLDLDLGQLGGATLFEARDAHRMEVVSILVAEHPTASAPPRAAVHGFFLAVERSRGVAAGYDYLVIERLSGDTLHQRRLARSRRALELEEAMGFGIDALHALDVLHEQRRAHGSLTPHDLWTGGSERLTLLVNSPGTHSHALPRVFMSPEMLRGQDATCQSDLYALGTILYTMLVGREPFGATPAISEHGHLHATLPQSQRLPQCVYEFLRHCMAKEPRDRFPSATAARNALLQLGYCSRYELISGEAPEQDEEPTERSPIKDGVPTLDTRAVVVQHDGRTERYTAAAVISEGWLDLEDDLQLSMASTLPAYLGAPPGPQARGKQHLPGLSRKKGPFPHRTHLDVPNRRPQHA
jgi:serine/threonine protein kinase